MVITISKNPRNIGCHGPSLDAATVMQARSNLRLNKHELNTAALRRGGWQMRSGASDKSPTNPTQWNLGLCSVVLYEISKGDKTCQANRKSIRSTTHKQLARAS